MKLPNCSSCNYSFKWKQLFFGLGPKKCPRCGANQFVTAKKRRQGILFGPMIALGIYIFLQALNLSVSTTLTIGTIIIITVILLNPFMIESSDKDEPLF